MDQRVTSTQVHEQNEHVFARLRSAGALSRATAVELPISDPWSEETGTLQYFVAKGVIVSHDGRFYLDETALKAYKRPRGVMAVVGATLVLLLIVATVWFMSGTHGVAQLYHRPFVQNAIGWAILLVGILPAMIAGSRAYWAVRGTGATPTRPTWLARCASGLGTTIAASGIYLALGLHRFMAGGSSWGMSVFFGAAFGIALAGLHPGRAWTPSTMTDAESAELSEGEVE